MTSSAIKYRPSVHRKTPLTRCLLLSLKLALSSGNFDGPLAPIVSRPTLAYLPPETKDVLHTMAIREDVQIATMSGWREEDVKDKVGLGGIAYSGSRGNVVHLMDGTFLQVHFDSDVDLRQVAKLKRNNELCPSTCAGLKTRVTALASMSDKSPAWERTSWRRFDACGKKQKDLTSSP